MSQETEKSVEPTREELLQAELRELKANAANNERAYNQQSNELVMVKNQLTLTETNLQVTRTLLDETRKSDIDNRVDVLTLQSQHKAAVSAEMSTRAQLNELSTSYDGLTKHARLLSDNLDEARETLGANQQKLSTTRTDLKITKAELSDVLESQLVDDVMIKEFIEANYRPSVSRGGLPTLEAIRQDGKAAKGKPITKTSEAKKRKTARVLGNDKSDLEQSVDK